MRQRQLRMLLVMVVAIGLTATAAAVPVGAVVGGGPADPGDHGFMALVTGTEDGGWACGGTVVAPDYVLTAAHCVEPAKGDVDAPDTVRATIGRHDLSTNEGRVHEIAAIHVHPAWDPGTSRHDVALLHLATHTSAAPIALADASHDSLEADGAPLTVAGWGSLDPTGFLLFPDRLQEAQVTVMSDQTCQSRYELTSLITEGVDPDTMVCAGAVLRDACSRDSGGPMFAELPDGPVQVGVVSWGFGCATPTHPGVYAEVNNSAIRSWIRQTIEAQA